MTESQTFLAPHLVVGDGAAAIDFYVKAFGATELGRVPGPDGKLMHAALTINGSNVYLNDDFTGGQIYLPELGVEYQPRTGSFCFFPASRLHGVRRVEAGNRYTCAQWFNRI